MCRVYVIVIIVAAHGKAYPKYFDIPWSDVGLFVNRLFLDHIFNVYFMRICIIFSSHFEVSLWID